jgi:hypothetical protein
LLRRRNQVQSSSPVPMHYASHPEAYDSPVSSVQLTPPPPLFLPGSQSSQGTVISWPSSQPRVAISRATSRASSRASNASSQGGVVRTRRGQIRPGEDVLHNLRKVDTSKSNFRLSAKVYWLTYSQIGETPNSALDDKIAFWGARIKGVLCVFSLLPLLIAWYIVWMAAEEHYQDGGRHWHVYINFHIALRSRDKKFFDVAGLHPNIQTTPNSKLDQINFWNYLHKEAYNAWGTWEGPSTTK